MVYCSVLSARLSLLLALYKVPLVGEFCGQFLVLTLFRILVATAHLSFVLELHSCPSC